MTALDRLEAGDPGEARAGILRALEWPKRLGQGRPYEPEERLAHFLLAQVEGALGNAGAARAHYQQVAAATGWRPAEGSPGVLDLLGHVARRELDEAVSLDPAAQAPASLFRGVEGELVERVLRRAGVR
jgi:hypothetical protein